MAKRYAIVMGVVLSSVSTGAAQAGPPCDLPSVEVDPPVAVSSDATTDGQRDDLDVSIACAGSTCIAVWWTWGVAGNDADLYFCRSTDHGETWSSPSFLNADALEDDRSDYWPSIASDGAGTWVVVWHAENYLVSNDLDVYVARSVDDGLTWSSVAPLNSNASTDNTNDVSARVVYDGLGTWIAVWGGVLGGTGPGSTFGIQYAVSSDGGATWSAQAPIDGNADPVGGVGDERCSIAAANGRTIAVWSSNRDIAGSGRDFDLFYSITDDGGATWSSPVPFADATTDGTSVETDASLATDGSGTWVAVFIRSPTSVIGNVLASRSTNNGDEWSLPVRLNVEPSSGLGGNTVPQVGYNGQGRWLAVWQSFTTYNNYLHDDHDILAAVSNDGVNWTHELAGNRFASADYDFEDIAPALTHDGNGGWLLAWESEMPTTPATGDDYDIMVARLAPTAPEDCNNNGTPDPCEVLAEAVADVNVDGVPDECQPPELSPIHFSTVELIGEPDPAGGVYEDFRGNQCLADDSVFYDFRPNPYGLAFWQNGLSTLVAASGTHAPGTPVGVNFNAASSTFKDFAVGDNGAVAFYAGLTGTDVTSTNDFGIWHWDGSQVSLVVREGDTPQGAPRTVTWVEFWPTIGSSGPRPRISPTGEVGFTAKFAGPGISTTADTGAWIWSSGTLVPIAMESLPAAGTNGQFGAFALPLFDALGHACLFASVTGNRRGIWFGTPGNLDLVVLEDEPVPGEPAGVTIATVVDDHLVSKNGHVIYRVRATGEDITFDNDDSIWRYHNGDSELVVAAGDASSDVFGGAPFVHVQPLGVTPDGDVLFLGVLDFPALGSNPRSVWMETDTGIQLIAIENMPAPGGSAGRYFGNFATNSHFAVNARGEVLFSCAVVGLTGRGVFGWTPNRGLFAVATPGSTFAADDSELGIVSGANISGYDIGLTTGPSATLNDNGKFSITVGFDGPGDADGGLFIGSFPDAADFNNDGVVDGSDQTDFCAALGTTEGDPAYNLLYDLNGDGTVDEFDQAEFIDAFALFCPGDIVDSATFQPPPDGLVDGADLAFLLGAWGESPSCADLVTGATFQPPPDGVVDGADLAVLLGAWGVCGR